jgi:heme-degrading monooxygenase HmoA
VIHHLCLVTYTNPVAVDEDAQQAIDAAYRKLPSLIPGILSMQAGRDLALLEGNADYAIYATFESTAAFEAYSVHDAHMEIIYPALGRYMASYSTAQFES